MPNTVRSRLQSAAMLYVARLRRLGPRPSERRQEPELDEALEAVADTEHRLRGLDERDELPPQLPLHAGREDRPGADVVARGEAARNHQDVEIVERPALLRRDVPRQLLQVDLLRASPEVPEVRHGFVLAVCALDEEDAHAHVGNPQETTTKSGIALDHAFRMDLTVARMPSLPD